jgi:hypothetical protein
MKKNGGMETYVDAFCSGSRRKYMVSFTSLLLYHGGMSPLIKKKGDRRASETVWTLEE